MPEVCRRHEDHSPAGGREPIEPPPVLLELSGFRVQQAVVLDREPEFGIGEVHPRDESFAIEDPELGDRGREPHSVQEESSPRLLRRLRETSARRATSPATRLPRHRGSASAAARTATTSASFACASRSRRTTPSSTAPRRIRSSAVRTGPVLASRWRSTTMSSRDDETFPRTPGPGRQRRPTGRTTSTGSFVVAKEWPPASASAESPANTAPAGAHAAHAERHEVMVQRQAGIRVHVMAKSSPGATAQLVRREESLPHGRRAAEHACTQGCGAFGRHRHAGRLPARRDPALTSSTGMIDCPSRGPSRTTRRRRRGC